MAKFEKWSRCKPALDNEEADKELLRAKMGQQIDRSVAKAPKKSKSKSSHKANHKHEYERVLVMFSPWPRPADRCKICGRISNVDYFIYGERNGQFRELLTDQNQIVEKYKDLPQVPEPDENV